MIIHYDLLLKGTRHYYLSNFIWLQAYIIKNIVGHSIQSRFSYCPTAQAGSSPSLKYSIIGYSSQPLCCSSAKLGKLSETKEDLDNRVKMSASSVSWLYISTTRTSSALSSSKGWDKTKCHANHLYGSYHALLCRQYPLLLFHYHIRTWFHHLTCSPFKFGVLSTALMAVWSV